MINNYEESHPQEERAEDFPSVIPTSQEVPIDINPEGSEEGTAKGCLVLGHIGLGNT